MHDAALAARIDHTALRPETTHADADRLVREALRFGFAAVCVHGRLLERVRLGLDAAGPGANLRACAVAAFPHGCATPTALAMEGTLLAKAGADEIDAVAWLPGLLAIAAGVSEDDAAAALRTDLVNMVRAVRAVRPTTVVKVILETAALREAALASVGSGGGSAGADALWERMIAAGCRGARESGCDFVKTSTGFHPAGGASVEAVRLLRKHAGPMRIKASAGIRTRDEALRMIEAGADRIGTSAGVAIVGGA